MNTPLQLLTWHWDIFDSGTEYSEVDGEGVIGEKASLEPGESFDYESACSLTTDVGKMSGLT